MSKYLEREHVCEVLYKRGLLTLEQVHNITLQDEKEQLRVLHARRPKGSGIQREREHEPTIVDLLTTLRLKLPDGSGDLLSEEVIMHALAEQARLP